MHVCSRVLHIIYFVCAPFCTAEPHHELRSLHGYTRSNESQSWPERSEATVVASTYCSCFKLPRQAFLDALEKHPEERVTYGN